jgi:hypothetical protein
VIVNKNRIACHISKSGEEISEELNIRVSPILGESSSDVWHRVWRLFGSLQRFQEERLLVPWYMRKSRWDEVSRGPDDVSTVELSASKP